MQYQIQIILINSKFYIYEQIWNYDLMDWKEGENK
jgi:hypothetical protein